MMDRMLEHATTVGVEEVVIGMAHRGRLNVLAAVMGKPYHIIFHEFQGGSSLPSDVQGSGDVKYHLGTSADRTFDGLRAIHVIEHVTDIVRTMEEFHRLVRPGDTIQPTGIIKSKQVTKNSRWVLIDVMVKNQAGEKVATGEAMVEFPAETA